MTLQTISPKQARKLLDDGAVLVDIREKDEHAREHIAAARHLPLSKLDGADLQLYQGKPLIFHCRSGARTSANAQRLKSLAGDSCEAFIVGGGLDAWRKAGLPTVKHRGQPIEIQRQVQIVAGGLGFAGVLLGAFVSSWFLVVPGFIGAGLLLAGVTGTCGMARLLMLAPWNRGMLRSA